VIFFRILKSFIPSIEDFESNAQQGKPLPLHIAPDLEWLWSGISVYANSDQAIDSAIRYPRLGRFLATLDFTNSESVHWERTTPREGHYTVWGDPEEILLCVIHVNPILVDRQR